jgi:imidazole glycerol-phosphate synthase subunit HisH
MIAVIDYGAGNLGSVANALASLNYPFIITGKPAKVLKADAVVFPGVGAGNDVMKKLESAKMVDVIHRLVADNKPLFAICVGLQVLLSSTREGGGYPCLNIIEGTVKKLPVGLKIPHMGWNQVKQQIKHPLFRGIPDLSNFYFVHSYYADPVDKSVVAGTTDYDISFCSMIVKNNLVATQFHPEKSGRWGLQMYRNFFDMVEGKITDAD